MSRYKFPASIPRKVHWADGVGGRLFCPECKGTLEREHHAYMIAVRKGGDIQPFIFGNDDGHFCSKCPVVVLDHSAFSRAAVLAMGSSEGVQFIAMGIVDLDAVPKDKRHLPFDDENNPVPLVEFTNLSGPFGKT